MKKVFISLFVLMSLVLGSIFGLGWYWFKIWTYQGEELNFIISPGETFGKVNTKLANSHIINSTRAFYYLARYENKMGSLNHGLFLIKPGMSLHDILQTLCGPSNYPMVHIPEGKNLYEIAKILELAGITSAKDFISAAKNKVNIAKTFDQNAPSVEGYLFPESYRFAPGTNADEIIRQMIDQFYQKTKGLDITHPFLTKAEVITLASIVEKETGAQFERRIIAGVFTNRLKKRMRLQSDPTTIYGIWEQFDGNLRKKNLIEKSAYNTYVINALPVGPIANPSLEAINAALNPEQNEYLYFVSKNDGTHVFSKSYAEHDKAVTTFQRIKANREGKSWRQLIQKK